LVPARTYRAADFLLAAAWMGLDLVVGSDGALPVGGGRPVIPVNPADPDGSTRRILTRSGPVDAVVAADTPMLMLAAAVAGQMGLPHNPPDAVLNATDKARQRQWWAAAGIAQPTFRIVPAPAREDAIRQAAVAVGFPCMVKAVSLSASQGVLRAGDPAAAAAAAKQIRHILDTAGHPGTEPLLVERYLSGPELSIDAMLTGGGLCSRALRFPGGKTLEELVLAGALGQPLPTAACHPARPAGIYMLPVPRPGVLRAVEGRASAAAVPGITGLTITIPSASRFARSPTATGTWASSSPRPVPGTKSSRHSPPHATHFA
jgi:hypothetical protein